jgi:hypothetical protein
MARTTFEEGLALCRPLYYDYPEAPEAYEFKEEYMFGDQMLIAPVTNEVNPEDGYADVSLWLPEGEWLEYETGEMLQGGKTYQRRFTMDEYPVYVKAGSIIPYFGKLKNLSGTSQPVILRIFPGAADGTFTLYEDNGEDKHYATAFATTPLSYVRKGNHLQVTIGARKGQYKAMPARRHYSVALPCQKAPLSVRCGNDSLPFTYDGANLEATVALGDIDCAAGAVIDIEMPADYALADGTKANFRHIQTMVRDFKQHDAGMVYTEDFGYLEATPLRLTYHPELQEETLKAYREKFARIADVLHQQMPNEAHYSRALRLLNIKF